MHTTEEEEDDDEGKQQQEEEVFFFEEQCNSTQGYTRTKKYLPFLVYYYR